MSGRHRPPRSPLLVAAAGVAVATVLTATVGTIVTVIDTGAMPPAVARISTDDASPASRAPEPR